MAENTTTTLAAVEFHGATLVSTLVDGVPHVALRPLCDAIGLDWTAQRQRITRDPVLSSVMVMTTTTGGDGKRYEMNAIPLKVLNGWLFGVDTNRVAPEVRERLIEYQRECYDALADYWQKGSATNPRASAASLMIGKATGIPTSQMVALQIHARKLVEWIKEETVRELRADLYAQLIDVYADMDKTPPPLAAIGWEAPEASADVAEFFAVIHALARLGHPVNHARNPAMLSFKMDDIKALSAAENLDLPPVTPSFKRQLRASKAPRFIETKSVSSAITGKTEHCWVFEVLKGGAA